MVYVCYIKYVCYVYRTSFYLLLFYFQKKKKKKKKKTIIDKDDDKMVLGEFDNSQIEDMASDVGLKDFYIEKIQEHGVDESDNVIINLALEYMLSNLEQAADNNIVLCKECLIMQYLDLYDVEIIDDDSDDFDDYCAIAERKRTLTLHDVLNIANND